RGSDNDQTRSQAEGLGEHGKSCGPMKPLERSRAERGIEFDCYLARFKVWVCKGRQKCLAQIKAPEDLEQKVAKDAKGNAVLSSRPSRSSVQEYLAFPLT